MWGANKRALVGFSPRMVTYDIESGRVQWSQCPFIASHAIWVCAPSLRDTAPCQSLHSRHLIVIMSPSSSSLTIQCQVSECHSFSYLVLPLGERMYVRWQHTRSFLPPSFSSLILTLPPSLLLSFFSRRTYVLTMAAHLVVGHVLHRPEQGLHPAQGLSEGTRLGYFLSYDALDPD